LGDAVEATGRSPLHALKQLILEKTEGFDTKDLQEAKILLDELAENCG